MDHAHSSDNKRIAKNTLFLYGRSLLTMVISVYTSRVILSVLGVDNYGIYNVVGGVVAMFSMLSATFSSATQRFLSFELGRNNKKRVRDVFSTSLNIHFLLAFIIFILMETVGLWFLNYKLKIPPSRMYAANWVLQCSIITFVLDLISIPYNAAIIAYEKMNAFAYISIVEVTLKLAILYPLTLCLFDKLEFYAVLMMGIAITIRIIYGVYCGKHFEECKHEKVNDKSLYKEMLGISGWNFLGSGASILTVQGINILLNLFGGGVVVNAAKGVAGQIESAVTQLVNNFMTSLNPQITKSYAADDQNYMISLINRGSRFSFYLMCVFSLPIILEADTILKLWLKTVPDYAVAFVRMTLIYIMIRPFSTLLDQTLIASGRIRNSQTTLCFLQLLNLPLAYFVLKMGYPPYSIYAVYIFLSWCSLSARLYFVHNRTTLSYHYYLVFVLLRSWIIIPIAIAIPIIIITYMHPDFLRLIIVVMTTVASTILTIFLIGLDKNEKDFFAGKIKQVFVKWRNR
jgi:O-antigen/teichoic acid export membrane protein